MEQNNGYRGPALETLERFGLKVWDEVVLHTGKGDFKGIILPRAETGDDRHIVLKMSIGYNVGVSADGISSAEAVGEKVGHYQIPEKEFPYDPAKPNVTLLGTGGTIASRLDYRTGAVIPAFSPGELYGAVPELADICNIKTEKLYAVFSENMGPEQWMGAAKAIAREIESGADGIIIGHGTDTLHHTGAALSFMVRNLPVPVVLVGSQRSSDRPSSDAAFNLLTAANVAANGDIAEVMISMFGPTSDSYNLLHRGTRVRKMHSSYRSTFRTISDVPLGMASPSMIRPFASNYNRRRKDRDVELDAVFDDRVAIVYYYPNMKPDIIESLTDNGYRGIVIAGTGLGHVNKPLYEPLRRAIEEGIHVFMTVQTLWGYAHMYVYDTGRDLLQLGVIPADNMLPEVAYVKLGWVLGHTQNREEVKKMMLTPVAGEITEREPPNGYLIFQGEVPEVEAFLRRNIR